MSKAEGLPTGPGTAPKSIDVADPHPSDEEHHDRERNPGGKAGNKAGHLPPDAEEHRTQSGKGDDRRRNTTSA